MFEGIQFLQSFTKSDISRMMELGSRLQIIANTVLIQEGRAPEALYIPLEGLLVVRRDALSETDIVTLGPGELVGEISFLDGKPASASVIARENSLVLAFPIHTLKRWLKEDDAFAGRFYRSLAKLLSSRLRSSLDWFGQMLQEKGEASEVVEENWAAISPQLDELRELLCTADKEALANGDEVPEGTRATLEKRFQGFVVGVNDLLGDASTLSEQARASLGARIQRAVLPYLLLTRSAERWYSKPRGYAGDFLTIDWLYKDEADGTGRLGPVLDRCFMNMPAAKAVQNRRGLLSEEIHKVLQARGEEGAQITSLASGPAQEVFDVYQELPAGKSLKTHLVDIDLQSLAFVSDKRDRLGLRKEMELHNMNLVYLALGRQKLNLPPQDLIYSIGLIDYFNDKFVCSLLDFIHGRLAPGGKVILGNFHPRNTTKAMMDYVLDWKLIHRDEDDLNRLFEASAFGRPCTEFRYENEGVNLFGSCAK